MYSAVVLSKESHDKLAKLLHEKFPIVAREKWEVIAHHMTITMGELPIYLKADINEEQTLDVTHAASDDKVIAVRVAGYYTSNAVPHITLAVNRSGGGKPVMSNKLTKWIPLTKPFAVKGVVEEVS